jgi:saccharopine dehydrogenase (NAD+, L-lysine forming)
MKTLWLRAEKRAFEKRTPLTPQDASTLMKLGIDVFVEKSTHRIYSNEQYERIGANLVEQGSYVEAPANSFILGIKELEEENTPITQNHIYFGHAFKNQQGASALLQRFCQGGGVLFDVEFLQSDDKTRACYFGYHSGIAGALLTLAHWQNTASIPSFYYNIEKAMTMVKSQLNNATRKPSALIIGYKGRCGQGVKHILSTLDIKTTYWDIEHTTGKKEFPEIFTHDLLFNCIYLKDKIAPFISQRTLDNAIDRKLSLINDIACDPDNPHNPLPIYDTTGDLSNPIQALNVKGNPLSVIAVSNLPSFIPKESSDGFSSQLLPYLKTLLTQTKLPKPWSQLKTKFFEHADKKH